MAFEKRWAEVPPQSFTADGDAEGVVQVADSLLFRVKQAVLIKSNAQPALLVQVKSIESTTEVQVGPLTGDIFKRTDVSMYLVADGASIFANEQVRSKIGPEDFNRAVFDEEPAVRLRTGLIDQLGNSISTTSTSDGKNRLAVDADVTVNSVLLFTKPYDSVTATYPSSAQEVYASRVGGIAGVIQETVTVNYTDSTKNFILNVARV